MAFFPSADVHWPEVINGGLVTVQPAGRVQHLVHAMDQLFVSEIAFLLFLLGNKGHQVGVRVFVVASKNYYEDKILNYRIW
jgi:hypothetical protein